MEKWVRPAGSPAIEFEASYDPKYGVTYGCEGIGYPYESIVQSDDSDQDMMFFEELEDLIARMKSPL